MKSSSVTEAKGLITEESQLELTGVFISLFSCGVVINFQCILPPFFPLSATFAVYSQFLFCPELKGEQKKKEEIITFTGMCQNQ